MRFAALGAPAATALSLMGPMAPATLAVGAMALIAAFGRRDELRRCACGHCSHAGSATTGERRQGSIRVPLDRYAFNSFSCTVRLMALRSYSFTSSTCTLVRLNILSEPSVRHLQPHSEVRLN